jgi:hypothetical protein
MELRYGIHQSFLEKYLEVEKNTLLPVTESAIPAWAAQFKGVRLISYSVVEEEVYRTGKVRLFTIQLLFDHISTFRWNHIALDFYPYRDRNYFVLLIRKAPPPNTEATNLLTDIVTDPFKVRIDGEFPGKILDGNATEYTWTKAVWEIPLRAIFSGPQEKIVAWVALPRSPSHWLSAYTNPLFFWAKGEDWKKPSSLPKILVEPLPPIPSVTPTQPYSPR